MAHMVTCWHESSEVVSTDPARGIGYPTGKETSAI